MKSALANGAVAHVTDRYVFGTAILLGKSNACSKRNLPAHNAMAAEEPMLSTKHVHTSALSLAAAGNFCKQLSHHCPCRNTFCQRMAMIAVGSDHIIFRLQHTHRSGHYCLLAYVEMAKTFDLLLAVQLPCLLLKLAH